MQKTILKRAGTVLSLLLAASVFSSASEPKTFENATLASDKQNDGDSFLVKSGSVSFRLTLCFVDAPETGTSAENDIKKLKEQTRYFGLRDLKTAARFGKEAAEFVERILDESFSVRALPGDPCGFATTSNGTDLGALLVRNGFARPAQAEMKIPGDSLKYLRSLENAARSERLGIWSESDPKFLAKRLKGQKAKGKDITGRAAPEKPDAVNLNTAAKKELMSIKGIGPVLAGRIIENRPFESVDELVKVKGIGKKTLEKIRPRLFVK